MPGVTEQEIAQAKQMNLYQYMQLCEPGNFKPEGPGQFRHKGHSSLTFAEDGSWTYFKTKATGRTALNYLIKVEGVSFVEAVREINRIQGGVRPSFQPVKTPPPPAEKKPAKEFRLPRPDKNNYAATAYLRKRCIHPNVLTFCKQKRILYAMKLEAISHQGERRQETSNQVGWKLESAHEVGQQAGDSGTQVRRYVRLNSLVPDLQKKVDSGTLKFNPAVELSYLTPDEQQSFLDYAEAQDCTPSLSQAQKLKAASKEGTLTPDKLEEIMSAQKPSVAPREPVLNINVSKVAQYFPTGCTKQQMENRILKILESYFRQMTHEQAHEEER